MMIKHLIAGAIISIAASCDPTTDPAPVRPAQVIFIPEDYNFPFNAERGDTLNLIMNPDSKDGMTQRCDHSGGRLNYNGATLLWICESIDF